MLISTKGRYALRVLIDLAEHQSDGYIPLKVIAGRQEISEKYLESIIKLLVKARFLYGLRGKGGGYKLTMEPKQYTVDAVLRLTEESLAPVSCRSLSAGGKLPHVFNVAGPGSANSRLFKQDYHRGFDAAERISLTYP